MKHLVAALTALALLACGNSETQPEQTPVLDKRTDGQYYLEKHSGEGGYRNELYSITLHTALNCPMIQKGVYKCSSDSIKHFLDKEHRKMRTFQYCVTCFTTTELDSLDSLLKE